MPIVQVEALPQAPDVEVERALTTLCGELAELLGEDPRGTWATWRTLEHYVEGADASTQQPAATHPPIVRVIAYRGREPDLVAQLLRRAADVLVRELRLEEGNVFVLFEEAQPGRLFTGGEVVGS
ncbi:MAG TPA: tautomerase family protein [Gaiellaceae bacterium]|nr:tautomerase family protein [Gaiellaceae bacterium]